VSASQSSNGHPGRVLATGQFLQLAELAGSGYECVHRVNSTGVVSIAARTDEGTLIFVEQFRPPLGSRTIELVAGLAGDGDVQESFENAARRELLEESGYEPGQLRYLFTGPSAGGMSSSLVTFYFADHCRKVSAGGGVDGEDIVVHTVPEAEAFAWLMAREAEGTQVDPKAFVALAVTARKPAPSS